MIKEEETEKRNGAEDLTLGDPPDAIKVGNKEKKTFDKHGSNIFNAK